MKPKVVVILGPTSSGKSSLAVRLAKEFNGEIISADSRQVYKDLNLGTGKITKKEMGGVPHYLLSVANPKKRFTVVEYQKLATKAINTIVQKKKLPVIVGGTGFYIDSIIWNTNFPRIPPNLPLRKRLEKKSTEELFKILKKKDGRRAKSIDSKNKVRLIRALEIINTLKVVPKIKQNSPYDVLYIGLNPEQKTLRKNIRERLIERIKKGMLGEAKRLHAKGLSWKRMEELGLEYKYLAWYLQNKISKDEMIKLLEREINQYSKRQYTWFKRNKEIKWFDISKTGVKTKIKSAVYTFIDKEPTK